VFIWVEFFLSDLRNAFSRNIAELKLEVGPEMSSPSECVSDFVRSARNSGLDFIAFLAQEDSGRYMDLPVRLDERRFAEIM